MTHRATVYLDDTLRRALKLKAAETNTNVSDLINRAIRQSLREDEIDLEAFTSRAKEPSRAYESVLKDLKRDGLL
jgi:Ribbon-helix-helix protein, copG family